MRRRRTDHDHLHHREAATAADVTAPSDRRAGHPGSDTDVAVMVDAVSYIHPDGRQALRGIDLVVRRGERVAVLGPNGAGKTTLALHLNGILEPVEGRVTIDGLPIGPDTVAEVRRRVGMVFQDPDDQLFMPTVAADVGFGPANLGMRGEDLDARVADALDAVGMSGLGDRAPHHLSFGQRRRAALATVLAMDPTILVLDEPSSNLDPQARREFAELVMRLGLTTLLVTHDLLYALQICPRSVVIDEGRIVADGPTAELLGDRALMAAHRLELPFGCVLPELAVEPDRVHAGRVRG